MERRRVADFNLSFMAAASTISSAKNFKLKGIFFFVEFFSSWRIFVAIFGVQLYKESDAVDVTLLVVVLHIVRIVCVVGVDNI